jgi:hypothetical protein
MSDELPLEQPASPGLPDVENLADSEDADVIMARAKLLEAQAALVKASTPLLDKIIIRGLLPLALAVVGPWALWKFDKSQVEQKKQGETIVALQSLLGDAKGEAAARQKRSSAWRVRMKQIEEEKAVELASMSAMVIRLDSTLKTALIQMTVSRIMSEPTTRSGPNARSINLPVRGEVIRDATEQLKIPGLDDAEIKKIASDQYDRLMKNRAKR